VTAGLRHTEKLLLKLCRGLWMRNVIASNTTVWHSRTQPGIGMLPKFLLLSSGIPWLVTQAPFTV